MAIRCLPVKKGTYTVSSGFGARWGTQHRGLDFAAADGTPIYASQGGTIAYIGAASGFGQWIVIDHPTEDGSGTTVYGHMWNAFAVPGVRLGARVEAGQLIAYVGSNGESSGPHLHFEVHPTVWRQGSQIDPAPWLSNATDPGGTTMGQFVTDETNLSSADDGVRMARTQLQVIHTNEPGPYKGWGASPGTVPGLLAYLADRKNGGSYHTIVGRDGRTGRSNDDVYAPWAGGYTANQRGLHLCALGWSDQPRDEWLSYDAQLNSIARILAYNAREYDIPLVRVTSSDIRAGRKGVCGHADTSLAWGETDHTDPGHNFPLDVVLAKANAINGGQSEEDDLTPQQHDMLVRIHRELTQLHPSRSLYRNTSDPVDTAPGFAINADGRSHEALVEVRALATKVAGLENDVKAILAAVSK
ncbi:N-acetylmuramoyl-L-alanine amidase [Rhodococcus sp. ACS1]|uniref:peptidoglycan DD-metalloendopeptidase family protein n=1 Tax=Rhodococcus sp. ACS1 TaxID=2028570 RepID=UPI000BB15114|nr:peptidoglycan DD-metalloendopeptidase family protein [Rhodococcus sp. ACS1]PBC38462.1 N-acetylmuramoyl-L-alanine amidase [Rhodococcus sp. ACS1]